MIKTDSYYHVDNGGVSITLDTDKDDKYTHIIFEADYYGYYPSISSTIHIGMDSLEILEMYREAITKHIAKIKITE